MILHIWVWYTLLLASLKHLRNLFISKKKFKKSSGYIIKTHWTYQGWDFISQEFKSFCKKYGIRRQLNIRKSLKQNDSVGKNNRTIIEIVGSILNKKHLPNELWVKLVTTSTYLLNISITKVIFNMTLYKAWYYWKLNISHLKVFGCICYALINGEDHGKIDKKSEKYIFIGYNDDNKGYFLYNLEIKKLLIQRDVIFDEVTCWNQSTNLIRQIFSYDDE